MDPGLRRDDGGGDCEIIRLDPPPRPRPKEDETMEGHMPDEATRQQIETLAVHPEDAPAPPPGARDTTHSQRHRKRVWSGISGSVRVTQDWHRRLKKTNTK